MFVCFVCVCVCTEQSRNSIEFIVQGAFMRMIYEIYTRCFRLGNSSGEKSLGEKKKEMEPLCDLYIIY